MNTNQLKTYAPKARLKCIEAIKTKLRTLGIEEGKIAEVERSGDFIFIQKQPFPKSIESVRQQIINKIEKLDFEQVLEQYAYTWFNRLCAIRFMELHDGYLDHGYRVLSHSQREQGLEFLDSAVEVAEYFGLDGKEIIDLKLEHQDEQLYRKLLLAQCNQLHDAMPFLFDPIDSVTSLLLPDDLTRSDSIIIDLVQQVDEESWQQVEIIGWLYQFYISELKDEVIGKVVATEDIPYATQLFTPNWIVKYMVQNSLGRYWLQTYPDTVVTIDGEEKRLKEVLEYYIESAEQEDSVKAQLAEITPTSIEPTSIKVIDPASGSGHILVEAYDLLKLIYQSQGHRERDIPKLILENNIFGLDIDDRAEQLTGFALMMKARYKNPRLFSKKIKLNICAFQNSDELNVEQIWQALNLNKAWQVGSHVDMFGQAQANLGAEETDPRYALIQDLVEKFKDAKAFGSLLSVDHSHETTLFDLKTTLIDLIVNGDSLQKGSAEKLLPIVEQAWILSQRYDAVIANPPYMGSAFYSKSLKEFISKEYITGKSDLYVIFIYMSLRLSRQNGYISMITFQNWMFLPLYKDLRTLIIEKAGIENLVHNGRGVWGPDFGTCSFTLRNSNIEGFRSKFRRLIRVLGSVVSHDVLIERLFDSPNIIRDINVFKGIPNHPIAYWIEDQTVQTFIDYKTIDNYAVAKAGIVTGDDSKFIKFWHELDFKKIRFSEKKYNSELNRYVPINKGGNYRRHYGNNEHVVNIHDLWNNQKTNKSVRRGEPDFYFKEAITWTYVGGTKPSFRLVENSLLATASPSIFLNNIDDKYFYLGFLNSNIARYYLNFINPTVNVFSGDILSLPVIFNNKKEVIEINENLQNIYKQDWDTSEISWEFKRNIFINNLNEKKSINDTFKSFLKTWDQQISLVEKYEKSNNEFFLTMYGLKETISAILPKEDISLNYNSKYRYKSNDDEANLKLRLQSDTIAELISYAIGCMMGRYSLDREGLVYAHEGNAGFDELVAEGAYQTFSADDDGILPLLDEERFPDDVYARFEQFIATAWNTETLQQNLDFIAESLRLYNVKPKNGESSTETIRRYLSNHFYKDHHLKTYKSRPIYWLFSSGKQKAFECLVYMHRFNDATLAKMRTQYVLPLMGQLTARAQFLSDADKDTSLSPAEKTKYAKEADNLHKKLNELKDFDAELKHHIEQKISIDLDDGVKVNYGKFAKLLAEAKKVTGNKE